jgi:HEPN domain-containing protein
MMRKNGEEQMAERSSDWLAQAKRDLENARYEMRGAFFEWACFSAQQAAEKAVKAVIQQRGGEAWGHSVAQLLKSLGIDAAADVLAAAIALDKYYVPARYPNGWGEGAPKDFFLEKDAADAIARAETIIGFCDRLLA